VRYLELVLDFRHSELALHVIVSKLNFQFAALRLHCALRYPPLRARITHYMAFLWEYYGNLFPPMFDTYVVGEVGRETLCAGMD
jgi:hypothetical protein